MKNSKMAINLAGYAAIGALALALLPLIDREDSENGEVLEMLYCYSLYDSCLVEAMAVEKERSIAIYVRFYQTGKLIYEDGFSTKKNFPLKISLDSMVSVFRYSTDSSYAKIKFSNYGHTLFPENTKPYLVGYVPVNLLHEISAKEAKELGYEYCDDGSL